MAYYTVTFSTVPGGPLSMAAPEAFGRACLAAAGAYGAKITSRSELDRLERALRDPSHRLASTEEWVPYRNTVLAALTQFAPVIHIDEKAGDLVALFPPPRPRDVPRSRVG